jgi:hypothetical protein
MVLFSFDILPCTFSITVSHSCVKKLWQLEPHLSVTFRLIYMSSLFGVNLSFAVHLPREKKYMKFDLDITKICVPQTDIHNNYSKARTVRTALFPTQVLHNIIITLTFYKHQSPIRTCFQTHYYFFLIEEDILEPYLTAAFSFHSSNTRSAKHNTQN